MWSSFCDALELDELVKDQRFQTNADRVQFRTELQAAIAKQCTRQPTAYWISRLRARGLLAAPVRTVGQAVEDPATSEMGLTVPFENFPGVYTTRLDCSAGAAHAQHVPLLGEHTREVLADIPNMTTQEIEHLLASGVVMSPLEKTASG